MSVLWHSKFLRNPVLQKLFAKVYFSSGTVFPFAPGLFSLFECQQLMAFAKKRLEMIVKKTNLGFNKSVQCFSFGKEIH